MKIKLGFIEIEGSEIKNFFNLLKKFYIKKKNKFLYGNENGFKVY